MNIKTIFRRVFCGREETPTKTIEERFRAVMKAFDNLSAAVDATDAELQKMKGIIADQRTNITDLQAAVAADTIDPVAVQALTDKLSTNVADAEATINPPPSAPAS